MSVTGKSDIVEVSMMQHAQTDKAIKASETGDVRKAVWLPKAQIEIEKRPKAIIIVSMPEWLAKEKGLI